LNKIRLMPALAYIWTHPDWPRLTWRADAVAARLAAARLAQGTVLGMAHGIGVERHPAILRDIWTGEVMATAGIEGETLNLDSVRSSVMRKIGMPGHGASSRHVDGMVDVMDDAVRNFAAPLTHARLFAWQAALFPTGRSGLAAITVGEYRTHGDPMQIVSGRPGKEKVHYVAPPSKQVRREMKRFLDWFGDSAPRGRVGVDGPVRAALAHLWFETIHPFEDGNGRIGRAICDLALAQELGSPVRIYSLATRLHQNRAQYYDQLNAAQCGSLDGTDWVLWFVGQFEEACLASESIIRAAVHKARFWEQAPPISLRQAKAVQKLLDAGAEGFAGGMSAEKYVNLTGASKATATRDLTDLAERGVLTKTGQGRGTRYWLPARRIYD